ncbi:hypothetical protein L1887_57732 [Cichorium endivia]|nr:hypothetical protein L1887_57732 [Cichorium endivia]
MSVDVQASSTATEASATRTAAPSKTEMLKQAALSPLSLLSLLPIPTPQLLLLHTLSLGPHPAPHCIRHGRQPSLGTHVPTHHPAGSPDRLRHAQVGARGVSQPARARHSHCLCLRHRQFQAQRERGECAHADRQDAPDRAGGPRRADRTLLGARPHCRPQGASARRRTRGSGEGGGYDAQQHQGDAQHLHALCKQRRDHGCSTQCARPQTACTRKGRRGPKVTPGPGGGIAAGQGAGRGGYARVARGAGRGDAAGTFASARHPRAHIGRVEAERLYALAMHPAHPPPFRRQVLAPIRHCGHGAHHPRLAASLVVRLHPPIMWLVLTPLFPLYTRLHTSIPTLQFAPHSLAKVGFALGS